MSCSEVIREVTTLLKDNMHLTIVKCAFYSQIPHICICNCRHLGFLNGGNAAFWMENEYRNVGFISETVDCSTTQV